MKHIRESISPSLFLCLDRREFETISLSSVFQAMVSERFQNHDARLLLPHQIIFCFDVFGELFRGEELESNLELSRVKM